MKRVAVYAGSFDPITNGHVEMVNRGLRVFDRVVVLVGNNIRKKTRLTVDDRVTLAKKVFADEPRVMVDVFGGLLVDYMEERNHRFVLRGLRAVSDFDYEFQMSLANRHLSPDIESVFLMASEEHLYVSSSTVWEVFSLGGDASQWVPPVVWDFLTKDREA